MKKLIEYTLPLKNIRFLFVLALLFAGSLPVWAARVKGVILDTSGQPMSFASVVVRGETIGTMANEQGEFSLDLPGGKTYELVFQFLGYKTVIEKAEVGDKEVFLRITMQEQSIRLGEVKIGKSNEDPAYSIMRKAIAKSRIHDKQVEHYDADIYVKNTLLINKVPLIFRKQLEKNNIKIGVPFVSEALINLKFTQPNKRVTRVLAKKLSFDEIDISGAYYLVNFYDMPRDLDLVSPLSPKAFSYYRFEYLGFFEDRGRIVNKIKIIPRSYGPGVCRGTIYIIDDLWCIHSIDAETVNQGFTIRLKQLYSPLREVWVPVSQVIDFGGKPFGFDFDAKMQISPKYKTLQINEKYVAEVKVLDSKDAPQVKPRKEVSLSQKELTLRELNRLARQMEKEEKATQKKEERSTVTIDSVSTDSMALKRSAEYWESVRSIPLTLEEKKGYQVGDSIRVVQKIEKDSTRKVASGKAKNTLWREVFIGNDMRIGKKTTFSYTSPLLPFTGINYNIVEGIFAQTRLNFSTRRYRKDRWSYNLDNRIRYASGMNRVMAASDLNLRKNGHTLMAGGGSFTQTFDSAQAIPAYANSVVNLFKINLMQLYMKEGGYLGYSYTRENIFRAATKVEFAHRSALENLSRLPLAIGKREPSSNSPANEELDDTRFDPHNAVVWSNVLQYRPGARYRIRNGRKSYAGSNWPTFILNYTRGMNDVNYDFLSFGLDHSISSGPTVKLKYYAETGTFLNASQLYLMDMKHVNSVKISETATGTYSFYRLLNTNLPVQISPDHYYRYSTKGAYVKLHAINEFRKLLVTQIPVARFTGLKEDLFFNYLKTPAKKNYLEVGYGIDGIFKLLRFEVITAFEKGEKQRWGWQVGITF
ncbi:DUF5686 and carboxypeptidase regulatory-like domain-containing protein [Leadbetterella sp. DM7]|uniref:DUF5686 and carboxypeptidase regulatory-like domain-containing protein n=1 Tax=Leadbetterella sp. DM7 TaxID=3235085 RepID=UPI00349EBD3F